ncbi:hypothetical protein C5167_020090 [Papaver somniferum]|uniref:Uncharacterized protein n=1 Tax=Papaver somniferum TaxID=3469 RepID=A0A4Y7ISI8_PAPSO|nr:hypothetical protein C5167_020090 [Papaver somniferum]
MGVKRMPETLGFDLPYWVTGSEWIGFKGPHGTSRGIYPHSKKLHFYLQSKGQDARSPFPAWLSAIPFISGRFSDVSIHIPILDNIHTYSVGEELSKGL